jgi:hypothetical protein
MLITIYISNGVSRLFTKSFFDMLTISKLGIPVLNDELPSKCRNISVEMVLNDKENIEKDFVQVPAICKVSDLANILKNKNIPISVVDNAGYLYGLLPKNFAVVLIENF